MLPAGVVFYLRGERSGRTGVDKNSCVVGFLFFLDTYSALHNGVPEYYYIIKDK